MRPAGVGRALARPPRAAGRRLRLRLRLRLPLLLAAAIGMLAAVPLRAQPLAPRALPALGLTGALPSAADLARPFPDALPARIRTADSPTAADSRLVELIDCRDWLAQRRSVVGSDSDASWRVLRLQVVPCEAMALLVAASPALHSALPARFAQELVTARYPVGLWLAPSRDEQARLARPGSTLATASGKARWQGLAPDGLKLNAKGWQIQLTLLARGDFDHDGWEDAAFLWQAASSPGSLTDARLVVLTRQAGSAALLELPVDGLLPAPGR